VYKNILILTKSYKNGGYCVAGIDLHTYEWIRLVSNNTVTHGAISQTQMICANNHVSIPLDVVSVDILRATPISCQTENHLINPNAEWIFRKSIRFEDALDCVPISNYAFLYLDNSPYLLPNSIHELDHSLILAKVRNLHISLNEYGKSKASFLYNGYMYSNISITDPDYYNITNSITIQDAYIVISLPDEGHTSEFYEGNRYYKFIAKIFC